MNFLALIIIPFPSLIKVAVFRHVFGWKVGRGVRIGLSYFHPQNAKIGDRVRIGHFNWIGKMVDLEIGDDVVVGHANLIIGGRIVAMGDGAIIGRFNEINSILKPLTRGLPEPELHIGRRTVITASHKIDFTDKVILGDSVVFAGRLSNIWTHNRQDVGPVTIGANCYVGSGVQMVAGSSVGADCVVGLGSVITKKIDATGSLIAGVPAKVVKKLDEESLRLVTYPTRPDLDGFGDLADVVGE
tara:strand:+ start:47213 stop:47941 length:729 start_codon:yes stop_codon:yes gene_type:complete